MSLTFPDARRILNWAGLIALLLVVVPFVVYAVPGLVGAEGSFVVLSGSMEPSISTGDVVVVGDASPNSIEERDVITYRRSGADTPTTHRVVEITEQGGEPAFVTKGDANDQPDPSPVPASRLIGVVVFTIPYIGYVVEFVNTTMGFVALVVVPFLLLLVTEVLSMFGGGTADDADAADATDDGAVPGSKAADATAEKTPLEADADEGTIALTPADLRLSSGLLAGTTVYAGWIVYNLQEPWSFAVAFASGTGLILVGGMYYSAGDDVDADENSHDGGGGRSEIGDRSLSEGSDRRLVEGSLSVDPSNSVRVRVDSLEELSTMAATEDAWVIDDTETDGYYLCREGVVYEYRPESDAAETTAERDEQDRAADSTAPTEASAELGDPSTDSDSGPERPQVSPEGTGRRSASVPDDGEDRVPSSGDAARTDTETRTDDPYPSADSEEIPYENGGGWSPGGDDA
jgi:signal peptidase